MKKEIKHVASKLKKASKAHAQQSEILSNIVKRKDMAQGGVSEPYIGSYVHGSLGGVNVGNKSLQKFYSNPGFKMPKI